MLMTAECSKLHRDKWDKSFENGSFFMIIAKAKTRQLAPACGLICSTMSDGSQCKRMHWLVRASVSIYGIRPS